MEAYDNLKQAEKGAWLSISVYMVLSLLKLIIGYLFHSDALTADGFNNTTDILASIAVLIGLRISRKPPDHDHPYGHFRAETVASLVAAFIMAAVGLQVLIGAFLSIRQADSQPPGQLAAWTALFSAVIMAMVYIYNRNLSRKVNSPSIMAAALDNRSDALVSLGAFVGIMGAGIGWPWLDPVTAFIVGLVICKTAWDIFRESSHALTDGFDENKLNIFKTTIEKTPGVVYIGDLKARIHGNQVLVDVTIHVDEDLSIAEGHEISDKVEDEMLRQHQISHVHVHIEPKA
ncbi:cation diffusion facilitator family transporter [Paenibacillus eucommiae]|uniref:Cation diffusion facilitator family transporter n=1 Tax=Paenibacillus eucommiae TaxID=1355755 RepID=A0ABS4J2K1_9BACL|nr:cation diffusion facilitator family transporter [Paenibacillus eucommiae]MBP1993535.1 cation diffusion facilitator family transporter [Paenibacillus eucommiae]